MIISRNMEVDLYSQPSTSFRVMRGMSSTKRARSPGSPSPSERATKRFEKTSVEPLFLQADNCLDIATSWNGKAFLPDSNANRRIVDESWVARTRGLTIDSPTIQENSESFRPRTPEPPSLSLNDIYMASPEQSSRQEKSTPTMQMGADRASISIHAQNAHYNASPPPLLLSTDSIPTNTQSSSYIQCSTGPTPEGPHIHVYPATPSSPFDALREEVLGGSPYSFSQSAPKRKQVLTMGPRADCEKCRMRVPGHWMHFD